MDCYFAVTMIGRRETLYISTKGTRSSNAQYCANFVQLKEFSITPDSESGKVAKSKENEDDGSGCTNLQIQAW